MADASIVPTAFTFLTIILTFVILVCFLQKSYFKFIADSLGAAQCHREFLPTHYIMTFLKHLLWMITFF